MVELFRQLLDWIGANPGWAYLTVLLAAFAESVALVGLVVPGVMIMFGAGALIATGDLQFWPTCLCAVVGAVAGDGLSYWIGHRYRSRIRCLWPLRHYPEQLDRGVLFFERYGTKSVVLGRFFGPVRAIIPLVAGILQMHPHRFYLANIASALAWAPAYLAPGIVFGASLKLAAEAATRLAILIAILAGLIWTCLWTVNRLFRLLSPRASSWVQAMLRWADLHPKVGRIAQALADPHHPDAATLTALAAALLAAAAVAGASVGAGLFGAPDLTLNDFALDLGQSLHTPLTDHLMAILARFGSLTVLGTLALGVFGYLRWHRRRREAHYWLAACTFVLIATPTLGYLLQVPRPDPGLNLAWPWSFPSAAVLGATLSYGFLAIMLSRGMSRGRSLPYAAAALIILSVALARIYFGAEWLSDVVGSLAVGLVWISALGLAFRRHNRPVAGWIGLALIAALCTGGSMTISGLAQHRNDLARYLTQPPTQSLSVAEWRQRGCNQSPNHREDLWHRSRRPFDFAYAGRLGTLSKAMTNQGWRQADMLSWSSTIKLLSPSLTLSELPVIPHLHDGRHAALTMVKDASRDQRLALRLWASHCRIGDGPPIWLGTVTLLTKEQVGRLIALPVTSPHGGSARRTLDRDLARTGVFAVDRGKPSLIATRYSGLLAN